MPLRYVHDLAPAQWVAARLHPFAKDAGSVIPIGFDRYARVFHPAGLRDGDGERPVTWREIASAMSRLIHPEMQFGNVAGTWNQMSPRPSLWTAVPRRGSLPRELARALASVLGGFTRTPERCWFAVWEGWGGFALPKTVPLFRLPGRSYYLGEASVADAGGSVYGDAAFWYQSASMWWPHDRSWFVATEVDFSWTYVGGTTQCIDAVLAHPQVEALLALVTDGASSTSDRMNPAPSTH